MVVQQAELIATGRRKTSVASVRLAAGTGKCIVNGKPIEEYFALEKLRVLISQPLVLAGKEGKYDIVAKVNGGGLVGQAGAMRHAMARAIAKDDERLRQTLKQAGLLTRDQRMKERKKYGQPGARKRFQFSKR